MKKVLLTCIIVSLSLVLIGYLVIKLLGVIFAFYIAPKTTLTYLCIQFIVSFISAYWRLRKTLK